MTKIIPLYSKKALTKSMLSGLRTAQKKEKMNLYFGQKDLKGSFTVLVNNELIAARKITVNGIEQISWYITHAGLTALQIAAFRSHKTGS